MRREPTCEVKRRVGVGIPIVFPATVARTAACFGLATLLLWQGVQAQVLEIRTQIAPPRISNPPVIDGVIDAGEWENAAVIENFRQIQPVLNADPSERTVVYVAYDEDNMYATEHQPYCQGALDIPVLKFVTGCQFSES